MVKVSLLQTDNRLNLNYLLLSQRINKIYCEKLNYNYNFMFLENNKYNIDNKTAKLCVVNDFLQNSKDDILIFLDSDAWIQNGKWLNDIINNLLNDDIKQGCFSRDPYLKKNTFINSGSFILKINEFTRKMYSDIVENLEDDIKTNNFNKYGWEDQFYISNYVFNNKENFNIFGPETLNTPMGKVLRHNWWKNQQMFNDMNQILNNEIVLDESPFEFDEHYDKETFPNVQLQGYEYY